MFELLFGDWQFLEAMLLLILSKPLRQFIMVLIGESRVRILDDFFSGPVTKHLLCQGQSFSKLIDVVILHLLVLYDLNLAADVLAFLYALL